MVDLRRGDQDEAAPFTLDCRFQSVRAGRMEVERRTDKFDYSERNDAKSVSGRLESTPFLTLNVTAAARHSRGTNLPPKLQTYH